MNDPTQTTRWGADGVPRVSARGASRGVVWRLHLFTSEQRAPVQPADVTLEYLNAMVRVLLKGNRLQQLAEGRLTPFRHTTVYMGPLW